MMRYIAQRESHDCGIAVAAMLAGQSYEEAYACAPSHRNGLHMRVFAPYLSALCGEVWTVKRPARCTLQAYRPRLSGDHAILLRSPVTRAYHWVAYSHGLVYDPLARDARPTSTVHAERASWLVVRRVVRA